MLVDPSAGEVQNGTLNEVYEGSGTSDKQHFLIAIKFKTISPVRICSYFEL